MSQGDLFVLDAARAAQAKPLARSGDPVTSKLAARELVDSGRLTAQQTEVLEALQRFPGSTSAELAEAAGIDRYRVARRLPDLERLGRAAKGVRRICRAHGSKAVEWLPLDPNDGRRAA